MLSRKHILDGAFSIMQYLPNNEKTDNQGSPSAANTNISTKKCNTEKKNQSKQVRMEELKMLHK